LQQLKAKTCLALIILVAVILRLYFYFGHIFSDDAYYSFLGYSLLNGNLPNHFFGYPIFPLRINEIFLYALSFKLFGINESATIIFPFIFSILNIFLTYFLTKLITKNEKISLLAAFLTALFPTDIVFATIAFPDLINIFFIDLGIFFLIKAFQSNKLLFSILSGISFFVSMQFKENMFYFVILLFAAWIYFLIKKKSSHYFLLIPILFVCLNFFMEGVYYLITQGEFFYRLKVTHANYIYSYYDFFPQTAYNAIGSDKSYFLALLYQIFVINIRSIFLRRFYLFLPIIALVQSLINVKKKQNWLLTFWFIGLAVLLIGFTTSLNLYKPLDLHRSWYIYPLLMPIVILSALFLYRLKNYLIYPAVCLFIIFSFVMCESYETYFNSEPNQQFKKFIRKNSEEVIYTDPFTKYSIDLLRTYKNEDNSKKILGEGFNLINIPIGDWIIYNKKHVDELKLQRHKFPKFIVLDSDKFKEIASFGDFNVFERVSNH
jgi:4-amino-4-deoxy-L-arabinose transferase-like glycosyltransferase